MSLSQRLYLEVDGSGPDNFRVFHQCADTPRNWSCPKKILREHIVSDGTFNNLEKVHPERAVMLGIVSYSATGRMPVGNLQPNWRRNFNGNFGTLDATTKECNIVAHIFGPTKILNGGGVHLSFRFI
jgi:hypothetical protein